MKMMRIVLTAAIMWAGLAPATSFAQEEGPALGVADVVAVTAQQVAIIGTATPELADIGFAYYEVRDDAGILDDGYLPVLPDGSYRTYLSAALGQAAVGDILLMLWNPFADDTAWPVQINFMMGGDSVSATFTRIMATGDTAQIRAFLELMKETGQLSAQQYAQLQARFLVVQAVEVAAADVAAAALAETTAVTAANIGNQVTVLTRALYLHSRVPALTPSTRLIMQEAVRRLRAALASLRARLADPRNARQADGLRASIAVQEGRLTQLVNWLTTNGVPIP
ncbi:MAG: hypothetical protein EXS09_15820 [Gemmataceae bacterium]|nr:hypothetical protein [Gemmataceae bacterium]